VKGIFTNSVIYKRMIELKVAGLSNHKKAEIENAYMSTGNSIRNTRALSRKSCKENRRNVLDRRPGISKSCTRELARLKFSNAGPKIDIPRRRQLGPLQKLQQNLPSKAKGCSSKKDGAIANTRCAMTFPMVNGDKEMKDIKATDTQKVGKMKLAEASLADENRIMLMEECDFDKIDVMLAHGVANDSNIECVGKQKSSDKSVEQYILGDEAELSKVSTIENKLNVIMSCVSSDNEDDNSFC